MVCKNICIRYKAERPKNLPRYILGQKRCQVCDIFITWDGHNCPCCSFRLRVRPRGKKTRKQYRIDTNVQYL